MTRSHWARAKQILYALIRSEAELFNNEEIHENSYFDFTSDFLSIKNKITESFLFKINIIRYEISSLSSIVLFSCNILRIRNHTKRTIVLVKAFKILFIV